MKHTMKTFLVALMLVPIFANSTYSQQSQRIVHRFVIPDEPVEIKNLRLGDQDILSDRPFAADDDWMKGLTIDLTNTSGQTITDVKIVLAFPVLGDTPQPHVANLGARYKKPIEPDQTVRLLLGQGLEGMKAYLAKDGLSMDLSKAELRVDFVIFSDGVIWLQGHKWRRDPNNPSKFIKLLGSSFKKPKLLLANYILPEAANVQVDHCRDDELAQIDCTIPGEPQTEECGMDWYDKVGTGEGSYSGYTFSEYCGGIPGCPTHTYQRAVYNPCIIGKKMPKERTKL